VMFSSVNPSSNPPNWVLITICYLYYWVSIE
jgi:hypothetical protein